MDNPFLAKNTSQKPIAGVDPALRERLLATGQTQKLAEIEQMYEKAKPSTYSISKEIIKSPITVGKKVGGFFGDLFKTTGDKIKEGKYGEAAVEAGSAITEKVTKPLLNVPVSFVKEGILPAAEMIEGKIRQPVINFLDKANEERAKQLLEKGTVKNIEQARQYVQMENLTIGTTEPLQKVGAPLRSVGKAVGKKVISGIGESGQSLLQKIGRKGKGVSQAPKIEKVINEVGEQVDGVKGITIKEGMNTGVEEIKRVGDNVLKNNPEITRIDAEAMAKDVIENRKFNQSKVAEETNTLAQEAPIKEIIPEKPKTLFQKIGEAGKEIEAPKVEIKNFDDVVIERPKKMNALAKRIIESDVMPEETRAFVRENPSSYHEVLSDKEMRSLVDSLKEDELRAVFYEDESKASTFAGQKLTKKLQAAGRFEEANEIITRAEKIATKGGQITQAQKIWAEWLTPEGKLFDIKKKLGKEGRKLRPEDEKDLFDTLTKNDKLKNDLDDIVDKARETLDPKYFDEHKKLLKQYNDDLRQLQKKMSGLLPRKISDTLSTIMQGNILTPLSQIKNPLYNAFFLPFKVTQKSIATLGDAVYSFVRSKPRTVKISSPISYLKGFGKGIKEAGGIFIKGSLPDDAGKIDNYRAFYPIRALASAFTGKGLPVSERTGKVLVYDRVNKLIEGILGAPPEAMFRLLAFGDKPFYQATRSSVANELANLKGLTGMEKKIFTEFPEALSDDVIEVAARESVFQQDSTIGKGVNKGIEMLGKIKGIGGLAKFLARTQAIFVKTPVNVVSETLDFLVPPLSFAKGINAASKGKRRDALLYLGKATTGLMVNAVSAMLVKQGLVNGDLYEGKKQEALEYEAIPPRTINLTGIKRMVSGGNPKYKAGDTTIRYDILGILGASLEMQFAASKDEETPDSEGVFDTSMNLLSDGIKDVFRIGNFAMQQSFLQGTNTLLETIANVDSAQGESQLNNWFKNTFNLITAIPLPNTLGAMTRTSDVYTRETKGKTVSETFDNVIKERLFGTYDLPAKLGLFGEKILRTPEGRNAFVFNMIDPFKFQKIKNDRTYLELNNLYSKTKDVSVIPSIPAKSYTKNNENIELNGKQYEFYASLIGRQRKELVDEAVQSDFWTKLDNETKIDLLSDLYKKGMDAGKAKYSDEDIDTNPNSLILKWQYANDNPRATRIDYGYYLSSIGEDTNKSGEASKNDWGEYNEMVGKLQKSKTPNKNPFVK